MTGPPPWGHHRTAVSGVFDAVLAKSTGKSRDEVEQLLRDELAERDVEFPDSLIRAAADVLAHPRGLRGQVAAVRYMLRWLAELHSASSKLTDSFADAGVGAIKDPADRTSAWVDVLLDDDGKGVLRARRARLALPAGTRDQVAVRLQTVENATSGGVVAASVDELRVGALTHKDGLRYLPAIAAGRQRGERGLLTLGLSTMTPDAEPRLRIAPAEPA
jgi:hypothetical protein